MPHIDILEPKTHAFRNLIGQIPLTNVKDYEKSITVDLVKHDNPADMLKGTYGFVKATWSLDGKDAERASQGTMEEALDQMLSGKALGLGLETVDFIFRISGITRIDTHQIVRQRIGVTFSQQCSGDQFWTHQNCLIEPSIYMNERARYVFLESMLTAKYAYAEMVSSEGISIQAARSILPHCLETFIFMKVNLATLLFFHQKRIDDGSQTWQLNNIAQKMADKVCEVFPQLKEVFERNKTRFTFQTDASKDRKNTFSTGLYVPDPDTFDYHSRDFLYERTKKEMHLVGDKYIKPCLELYYWGTQEIEYSSFRDIKRAYEVLDEDNKNHPYRSNNQIRTLAELKNEDLKQKYL